MPSRTTIEEGERGARLALSTDLYELTMGASYLSLGLGGKATFSLFVRRLPPRRNFLVVAGVEEALSRLESLSFGEGAIEQLRGIEAIRRDALSALSATRFRGEVWAMPEGRLVFADEPLLEVEAPIVEAQLVETTLLNAVHFPTAVATKAALCVAAARGKTLLDFGLRRTPGVEAGLVVARACWLAGWAGTSNVLAGAVLGIPVTGTMAHSFVELFESEREAFAAFCRTFPGEATLLIDTYDTAQGARHAIEAARALAARGGRVRGVRIDSGDLLSSSRMVRAMLDEAGLGEVSITVSGGLDESSIAELTGAGAPIDAFGVGTRVGMSADSPVLDMAYKLVAYDGRPCLKLSSGKVSLIGPKQVYRRRGPDGRFAGDRICARDEPPPGPSWEPLLEPVLRSDKRLAARSLAELRELHRREIEAFPSWLFEQAPGEAYPVEVSSELSSRQQRAIREAREREGLADTSAKP